MFKFFSLIVLLPLIVSSLAISYDTLFRVENLKRNMLPKEAILLIVYMTMLSFIQALSNTVLGYVGFGYALPLLMILYRSSNTISHLILILTPELTFVFLGLTIPDFYGWRDVFLFIYAIILIGIVRYVKVPSAYRRFLSAIYFICAVAGSSLVITMIYEEHSILSFTDILCLMIGAAMILAIFDHYYARQEKKDQQYQETKRLAYTDSLTGMANFTAFSKQVAELENNWKNDIVVAILDLDHFKQINDTFGHLVGNEVLVLFTRNLQRILAKNISLDKFHLYRFGGEEFCAVFYDVSKEEVERSISNALDYFNEQPLILEDGRNISITFSGGITLRGTKDTTIKTTLNRADDSLYKAKKSGRNQLVVDC